MASLRLTRPTRRPPLIDLHPSEWTRKEKREPFLGRNGAYFLIMFPVAMLVGTIVSIAVTGALPYFLR